MNISDISSSSSGAHGCEDVQLKVLFDTFGSFCSLEDIALVYSNYGHNVQKAGEILCDLSENNALDASHIFNYETNFKHFEVSSQVENPGNTILLSRPSNAKKPKKTTASVGSISSLLGKTYLRPASSLKEPSRATKPLKLNVLDSSVSEPGAERFCSESLAEQNLLDNILKQTSISNTDVEEFLFSMLGDGFQLSMDSIREVLGNCGYNVKQSMEELLSLSAKTLEIGKAVDHNLCEKVMLYGGPGYAKMLEGPPPGVGGIRQNVRKTPPCSKNQLIPIPNCSNDQKIMYRVKRPKEETFRYGGECKKFPPQSYSKEISCLSEKRTNLSNEVLESLFSVPDRFEEKPKRKLEWGLNRTRVAGQKPVTMPFEEYDISQAAKAELIKTDSRKDDEEHYQVLRKATKQQWDTMKLYYEAAIDAFTKGDHTRASYCLEQGKHCYDMAREADEKSSELILEKGEPDEKGDELPLDLHSQSANESIRLLKLHLLSFASIPSFRYLKVIINTDDEDKSKGKRRKKKVMQLLQDESIKWSEVEGSPGTIMIPLDEIDPSMLSFQTDS